MPGESRFDKPLLNNFSTTMAPLPGTERVKAGREWLEIVVAGGWPPPQSDEVIDVHPTDQLVKELSADPHPDINLNIAGLNEALLARLLSDPKSLASDNGPRSKFRNSLHLALMVQPTETTLGLLHGHYKDIFVEPTANGHREGLEPDIRRQMLGVLVFHATLVPDSKGVALLFSGELRQDEQYSTLARTGLAQLGRATREAREKSVWAA